MKTKLAKVPIDIWQRWNENSKIFGLKTPQTIRLDNEIKMIATKKKTKRGTVFKIVIK